MRDEDRSRRSTGRRNPPVSRALAGFSELPLYAAGRSHPRVSVTAASLTRPNNPHPDLRNQTEEPNLAQGVSAPPWFLEPSKEIP